MNIPNTNNLTPAPQLMLGIVLVFLLDLNGQTLVYRLVLGATDVRVRRKRDSLMEEDDCAPLRIN